MTYGYTGEVVLGRVWLPNEGPVSIQHQGGGIVTLSGDIVADSTAQLEILREMMVRLPESADDVTVFNTLSADDLQGMYRVTAVSVSSTQAIHTGYMAPYQATLEPVSDFASPAAEVTWSTVRRTNAAGIAPANHYLRRAIASPGGWRRIGGGAYAATARSTFDGVTIYECAEARNTTNVESFPVDSSTWFAGICEIEVLSPDGADASDDDNWWPIGGTRLTNDSVTMLRLTNGLVRVTFNQGGNGQIRHELWNGSAWSPVDFITGDMLSYYTSAWQSPSIVRNDRDGVVLRLVGGPTNMMSEGAVVLTVSLLPGELWAGVTLEPSRAWEPLLGHATSTSCTPITGGLRSTGATPGGTRSVIGCSASFTVSGDYVKNTTAGAVTHFCIGQSLGGASATGRDTEVAIIEDWIATYSGRTRVVPK